MDFVNFVFSGNSSQGALRLICQMEWSLFYAILWAFVIAFVCGGENGR